MPIWQYSMSLRVQINNKLEQKFREAAMKRFGYAKGALSKAAEEAIQNWISTIENETINFEGDPVTATEGLLKDIDINSVTLQHETQKLWKILAACADDYVEAKACYSLYTGRNCESQRYLGDF